MQDHEIIDWLAAHADRIERLREAQLPCEGFAVEWTAPNGMLRTSGQSLRECVENAISGLKTVDIGLEMYPMYAVKRQDRSI